MTHDQLLTIKNHAINRLIFACESVIMVSNISQDAKNHLADLVETARKVEKLTINDPVVPKGV